MNYCFKAIVHLDYHKNKTQTISSSKYPMIWMNCIKTVTLATLSPECRSSRSAETRCGKRIIRNISLFISVLPNFNTSSFLVRKDFIKILSVTSRRLKICRAFHFCWIISSIFIFYYYLVNNLIGSRYLFSHNMFHWVQ